MTNFEPEMILTYIKDFSIFRLYETGIPLQISKLYPAVEFPVSKGTPMISPLIKWYHQENWYTFNYKNLKEHRRGQYEISVSLRKEKYEYFCGHEMNGKHVFPAAGYLVKLLIYFEFVSCHHRGDRFVIRSIQ